MLGVPYRRAHRSRDQFGSSPLLAAQVPHFGGVLNAGVRTLVETDADQIVLERVLGSRVNLVAEEHVLSLRSVLGLELVGNGVRFFRIPNKVLTKSNTFTLRFSDQVSFK